MSPGSGLDAGGLDGGAGDDGTAPAWMVFGDLMSGLVGAFVLLLVATMAMQLALTEQLRDEVARRQQAEQGRTALERALAGPLASGRVTMQGGRIGIAGSLLFMPGSDQLQPDGRELLRALAGPLAGHLATRDELLMVSGFTDDRGVRDGSPGIADNWALSAQRALTVTRALVEGGVPSNALFAAAFGAGQPVASNDHAAGRALNRRVELTPVPRAGQGGGGQRSGADAGAVAGAGAGQRRDNGAAGASAPVTAPAGNPERDAGHRP